MNRLIILLVTLACVVDAFAQVILARRRGADQISSSISSPTNLTQRMFWYSGDHALSYMGEGVNAGTNLESIISGPTLFPHTSRFFGISNNWINGHAALLFLSASDQVTNQTTSGVTWSQPYYLFLVQRTTSAGATQRMLAGTNATGYIVTSGNLNRIAAGTNLEGGNATNAWILISTYFNGANSWIRTNGVTAAAGNAGTADWVGVTLGRGYDGGAGWSGHLAETFGAQDVLTTNDIIQLESYLGVKYGISTP